jgi:hypothetical protein
VRLCVGTGRARISQDSQESLLELGGDLHFLQLGRRIHGSSVRVDERHAGPASLDVPFQKLPRRFREASIEIIAKEVGYLPTFNIRGHLGITV